MTRLLAPVLVVLIVLAPLATACTTDPTAASPRSHGAGPAVVERVGRSPVGVLQQWDRLRARAWAAGDRRALRALYVRGSRAGQRDVAMLRRWRSRGLSIEDLEVQVLRGRIVVQTSRRLTVQVSERLVYATATADAPAGARRWLLPLGSVVARRVTLWRVGGAWRVARVARVARGSVAGGEP